MLCTIIGPPAPVTSLDISELCVNGFVVSWDPVSSNPVCGPVSYDVMISSSDEAMMMGINDTSYSVAKSPYNFTMLTSSANLNISVINSNLAGSREPRMIAVKTPELTQAVPSSEW